ncbi:hypothetical protein SOV_05370 [Sporomusa ovata DSM 2662]|uniref:Uncharacterized protein n=1 Tax=Sporomusa ovata TaxID=2378 RepID=A0A0U1KX92_9FIRM|nr:hypothetical protein [Sporomusa ovata]EQB28201.1 hypothetical protein SOV_2c11240 [Sporomusa ovata DSM 2662]CQR71739.1 hypothetical protein SpAn4DRAFT_3605 [Sporomusa ovata]
MPIDQMGLNNLLAIVNPQSNLTALRNYREGLQKKLEQKLHNNTTETIVNHDSSNTNTDDKQVIAELQSVDKQIQQTVYEEETRKLELERLKREASTAKNAREREKTLAKHERALDNASMNKLYSAISNNSQVQTMAGLGMSFSFCQPSSASNNSTHPQYSLEGKVEETERDLRESAEYGIAAAEVARRRKNNQLKADIEEAACKNAKKAKKKTVNITI